MRALPRDQSSRVVHMFDERREQSEQMRSRAFWCRVIGATWPGAHAQWNAEDNPANRAGVDVHVVHEGRAFTIDTKTRQPRKDCRRTQGADECRCDFGDFLLEVTSNDRTGAPGWMNKALLCDYLGYGVLCTGRYELVPWPALRAAWARFRDQWIARFGTKAAQNDGYATISVPVPRKIVWTAVADVLRGTLAG